MDKSFEENLPHFQAIISKYEALFEELTQELHSVKSEHDTVKSKLSALVIENQELSKELAKLQTPSHGQTSAESDEIIEVLKQQVKHLLVEKEHISKLWQNATRSVEILEGELRICQSGNVNENFVPKKDLIKIQQTYEERLKDLEHKLHIAEKNLVQAAKTPTSNPVEAPIRSCQNLTLESQAGALKIVKNLEDEVLVLQKRLQESEKAVAKLQKVLKEKDEAFVAITKKNLEYRDKVSEAIEVVHAALNEKDAALFREKEARDEIDKVSQELADIMKETEEKIKNEVAKVKTDYAKTLENRQANLKNLENEISLKTLEIEKFSTKCSLLESELDRFRKGNITMDDMHTSKLLVLEKNLESTFQKLLLSEKTNIQLASEKETIKNDIAQMADQYERILKTKEIEKLTFQNRIRQFQTDLEETQLTLKSIKDQLEIEKEEKKLVEKNLMQEKEEQEKVLTKAFTNKMTETTANFNEKLAELQKHLESKDQLNKKWSVESKAIVEKLEKLIGSLKKELKKTKRENITLKIQVEYEQNKFEQYKGFLQVITKDVDKITRIAEDNAEKVVFDPKAFVK